MPLAVPASLRSRPQELLTQRSGCAYSIVKGFRRHSRCFGPVPPGHRQGELCVGCIALLLHFDPVLHHLGASDLFAVKFHSAFGAVVRPCHRVHFLSNVSWCQTMQINLINDTVSVSSVFTTNLSYLRQIAPKGLFLCANIKIVLKIVKFLARFSMCGSVPSVQSFTSG